MRENKYIEMEKEIVKFSLEIYSNTTWEVGEYGSFLDFNIKVYIHYSTAQTGGCWRKSGRQILNPEASKSGTGHPNEACLFGAASASGI